MTFASLFGERLKQTRKTLGWSQAEAADIAGVSREYWGRCERGVSVPGGEVLATLASEGADINFLLTGQSLQGSDAPDPAELALLDSYRRCKPAARVKLIQAAALLAAGLDSDDSTASRSNAGSVGDGSMVMSNLGDGNVQIGSGHGTRRSVGVKRNK